MQIEEEPPIDDEIQHVDTSIDYESATDSKGFEAPDIRVLTLTINGFAMMFKQKLDICVMNCDDRFETL